MATPQIADLVALAVRLVNANQPQRARIVCEQAVAAWPAHPAVHQLLAVLDLQAGHPARAATHAALSLSCAPTTCPRCWCWATRRSRSATCGRGRRRSSARSRWRPTEAEAWFKVSLVRQDLHDLDGAAAALERVLAIHPRARRRDRQPRHRAAGVGPLDDALRAYGRAYRARPQAFGRIAHALATPRSGGCGWISTRCARRPTAA